MPHHYTYRLNLDHSVEPCDSYTASLQMGSRVAETEMDGIRISTAFLALNHQWDPDGTPLLFESMIFGGEHDKMQTRYSTWEDAVRGHESLATLVFGERANGQTIRQVLQVADEEPEPDPERTSRFDRI